MNLSFLKETICAHCGSKHFGLSCPNCGSHASGKDEQTFYVIGSNGLTLSGITESSLITMLEQEKIDLYSSVSDDGKSWHPLHEVLTIGGLTIKERNEKLRKEQNEREDAELKYLKSIGQDFESITRRVISQLILVFFVVFSLVWLINFLFDISPQ